MHNLNSYTILYDLKNIITEKINPLCDLIVHSLRVSLTFMKFYFVFTGITSRILVVIYSTSG